MSEMLDKVAKAIWAHMVRKNGLRIVGKWEDITEDHEFFRTYARAAIEAMRIPTKDMEDAGFQAGRVADGGDFWEYGAPDETYCRMIEEALK